MTQDNCVGTTTGLARGLLVAAFVGLSTAIAASSAANAAPKKGGKLRIAILNDMGGFDSLKIPVTGRQRAFVMQAMHETLFDMDPDTFKIIPRLGLKAVPKNDFKIWRITLRPGVKYSNGAEMVAADYKAHFDRLFASKFRDRFKASLGPRIKSVEAPEKYVLEFVFAEPSPGWNTIMTLNNLVWWVRPKAYLDANKGKKTFNNNTVGAGPYMLKKWRRGSSIVLAKNPHYWDKANQHVDEIHIRIIKQQISRFQALQSGQMDLIWIPPWLVDDAQKDKRLKTITGPGLTAGLGIGWHNSKPPFNDIRVRKAMLHALDRSALGAVITKVKRRVPTDMYGASHPWFCKDIKWPEYNPAKAKALLKDYGKPVEFTLNIVGLRDLIRVGEAHQAYWKEVGIKVNIKPGPRGPQWRRAVLSGKFDVWWNNHGSNADPSIVGMTFHSKSRGNIHNMKDPEVDAAITKVKAARGRDARYKASCDLQRVLAKNVRILMWEQSDATIAYWPHVKGLKRPLSIFPKFQRVWLDKK